MAYATQQTGSRRAATIVAVGAIHAAIGSVLIFGLAPQFVEILDNGPLKVNEFPTTPPEVPPPPPPTTDPVEATESIVTAPITPIPIPLTPLDPVKPFDPINIPPPNTGTIGDNFVDLGPVTPPTPAFKPKAPRPTNGPANWVTANDYPSSELNRGNEGLTRFRVVVGTNGRVQSCEILASSGHPRLDSAACAKVKSRARFEAATNDKGETVVDTYTGSVLWKIPK